MKAVKRWTHWSLRMNNDNHSPQISLVWILLFIALEGCPAGDEERDFTLSVLEDTGPGKLP